MDIVGWKLVEEDREILLNRFPPTWPDVIADHITLEVVSSGHAKLPPNVSAAVVGWVDDGEGLQSLVVEVDGTTARPDRGTFHITWSLDRERGREAFGSNVVIAERGWTKIAEPIFIHVTPTRW